MLQANHFAPVSQRLAVGPRLDTPRVISVTALAGVSGFVRHAFGEAVLRRANRVAMLDIEAIEDQDCFIPQVTMTAFAEAVAKHAGVAHFGLLLAPHLTIASYGCWGRYVLGAPTLGAAIKKAVATIGFHTNGDRLSLTVSAKQARLSYASGAKGLTGYPQVACGVAGVVLSLCRSFLPVQWRPQLIEFDIARPGDTRAFEDTFGCPVIFDARTVAVCFDAALLDVEHATRGASARLTVDDLARARVDCRKLAGLGDVLAEQIWSQVLAGKVSIDSAARSLDTSVRTLQRELNREGTDFRTLTSIVRGRRAQELLRHSDAPVTQISGALGYAAPAHFARAFRKVTGMSPQEFRRLRPVARTT